MSFQPQQQQRWASSSSTVAAAPTTTTRGYGNVIINSSSSNTGTTRRGLLTNSRPQTAVALSHQISSTLPAAAVSNRPMTSLGTRSSRRGVGFGMGTETGTRPGSTNRPSSGRVRPLSGRVFMRRTSEKGWVAKAYTNTPSLVDLDLLEDDDELSDCRSLDSFFDDDFDEESASRHEEKLQDLLSCNTLGIESKGHKPDWNAGECTVGRFHCPRCRDHWYGLTPFPCDEELARLIREGLWYTGKGGDPSQRNRKSGAEHHRRLGSGVNRKQRENESTSAPSLIPRETPNKRAPDETRDFTYNSSVKKPNAGKGKKRIAFKLEDEVQEFDGSSSTLMSDNKSFDEAGDYRHNLEAWAERSRDGQNDHKDLLDRSSHDGGLRLDSGIDLTDGRSNLDGRTNVSRAVGTNMGGLDALGDGHVDASGLGSGGGGGRGLGARNKDMRAGKARDDKSHATDPRDSGPQGNPQSSNGMGGFIGDRDGNSKAGSGDSGDVSRSSSNSQLSLSSVREDRGKSVRRPAAYTRAARGGGEPSQWDDPTHAWKWASSTATSSQMGSATDLLQEEDEGEEEISLPPIVVPSIANKKNQLDLSDLLNGFQLTRAWSFSYHTSSTASKTSLAAGQSDKSSASKARRRMKN